MKKQILTIVAGILGVSAASLQAQVIFSDPMESGDAWTVNATTDTQHEFGWDYSALGLPSAPNSGDGSTLGLVMTANMTEGAANELNAVVTDLNMSGQYTVKFDFWINANGPFPGGGSGSTEFIGGGVGMNGGDAGRDGASLIATGEGGSSRDWRLYKDKNEQFIESGQYNPALSSNNASDPLLSSTFPGHEAPALQQAGFPQQTGAVQDGSAGMAWREMAIVVDSDAGTARFSVDGLWIGTVDANVGDAVETSGGVGVIYADLFSSISDNPDLSGGVVDNFVVMVPEPTSGALALMGGLGMLLMSRRRK